MTGAEKTSLACFLDLAADVLRDGYSSGALPYSFDDDPQSLSAAAAAETAAVKTVDSIEAIDADIRACRACPLCNARQNAVPGEGARQPLVLVVGEGPGADEDASGRPFVGKAGQLLDKMLAAINLSRESNCFIANVVKCRPPNNRDPEPPETAACAAFLQRQIQVLKPRFILCAGKVAAQTLLKTADGIGKLRGKVLELNLPGNTIPLIATYHPSALLRNEEYKRPAWEDLKTLKAQLDSCGAGER